MDHGTGNTVNGLLDQPDRAFCVASGTATRGVR